MASFYGSQAPPKDLTMEEMKEGGVPDLEKKVLENILQN